MATSKSGGGKSRKPSKNHPWKLGLSGPVSYSGKNRGNWGGFYRPPENASPVKTLSPAEIKALGLELVLPIEDIIEARRMCQQLHQTAAAIQTSFSIGRSALIDCAGECANEHNKIRDVVMIQRIRDGSTRLK